MTQPNKKILWGLLLGMVMLYGLILRDYQLGAQSYWIDEGYTLNAVQATLDHGYPVLDSGFVYGRSWLHTYILAVAGFLFGITPVVMRGVAVLFGLGVIGIVGLLSQKLFSRTVAVSSMMFTALSYWEVAWSRQARMYIQLQFFFFLSLYALALLRERFSLKRLAFAAVSTGAAIASHGFAWTLLGVYVLAFLPDVWRWLQRIQREQTIRQYLASSLNWRTVLVGGGVLLGALAIGSLAITRFLDYWTTRTFYIGNQFQTFLLQSLPLIFALALLGWVLSAWRERSLWPPYLLVLAYGIPYFTITFTTDLVHYRYIFFILPVLFIMTSYCLEGLVTLARLPRWTVSVLVVATIAGSVALSGSAFALTPRTHYWLEPHTPQPNFAGAYQSIRDHGWSDDMVIISPYTQMDKLYLGRSSYWLAMSLSGKTLSLDQQINTATGREVYTNAIVIHDVAKLTTTLHEHHGYIILDDMARSGRLSDDIITTIQALPLVWSDTPERWRGIWVYAF